jgi:nitric oxide reductase subunit C
VSVAARKLLLSTLVAIFVAQTWLVYSDPKGRRDVLSEEARRGQAVWRSHNCQSCHQLYGFGGFLGPDLTNAIGALSAERLASILTDGAGQMPAFRFDDGEQRALAAFLEEIDATGVSQPKLGEAVPPAELLRQLSETEEPLPEEVARGREIVLAQACISCHLPNEESLNRSTDLTTLVTSVERERVLEILRDGIPAKGMPRLALDGADGEAVLAFLGWLHENGEDVRARFENLPTTTSLELSGVPWFEYE